MNTTLGGISVARPPPAQMLPSAIRLSYPRLSMAGSAMTPMVTISAPITPTMVAIRAHEKMTATASPPGTPPEPDVHGAKDGFRHAGTFENAGHENEQRH